MKNPQLSKALRLSFYVQCALILTGGILYLLPNDAGQDFVILLAPFTVGVPLAGSILGQLPLDTPWEMMYLVISATGMLVNFAVYTGIFYSGLSLRQVMLKMPRMTTN